MPESFASDWLIFGTIVVAALAVDLFVFHRKPHAIKLKEALLESAGWIGLSLSFNVWIYFYRGHEAGLQFLTAYLVEKSLSLDNILVFILIFASLEIDAKSQHKVLFYGVSGALVMRGLFVAAGIELLQKFHWVLFIFGAILLVSAVRMLLPGKRVMLSEENWILRLAGLLVPVTDRREGEKLWLREGAEWKATTLSVALIAVEAMDLLFAVDSVPAVLAITRDPFIAYSSNVFAILGLRALYFALRGALARLRYLHQGLAVILLFVAGKMVGAEQFHLSTGISLGVIGGILLLTVVASMASSGSKLK